MGSRWCAVNAQFSRNSIAWSWYAHRDPTRRQLLVFLAVALIATAACYAAHLEAITPSSQGMRMRGVIMGGGADAGTSETASSDGPMIDPAGRDPAPIRSDLMVAIGRSLPLDVRILPGCVIDRDPGTAAAILASADGGWLAFAVHGRCCNAHGQSRAFSCAVAGRPRSAPLGIARNGAIWSCDCIVGPWTSRIESIPRP
jgi:hypothetical protein